MNEILGLPTVKVSDLKKDQMMVFNKPVVCILNRGKPVYYTVSLERMAELVKAEEDLKALKEK